jgi:hypothetical protein
LKTMACEHPHFWLNSRNIKCISKLAVVGSSRNFLSLQLVPKLVGCVFQPPHIWKSTGIIIQGWESSIPSTNQNNIVRLARTRKC